MKKERIISMMFILTFAIMLMVAIKMKLFANFIPERENDSVNAVSTVAEVQSPANQGTNPYSKGDKVLDDTYLHNMNEDVYVISSKGEEMIIRVTDSYLTRDVTKYYGLMTEKVEFNRIEQEHVDSNGIFRDDYFYLVAHVTITNVGTEKGECLIPGMFTHVYLKDSIAPPSSSGLEIRYAAKMEGKGNVTLKGHLISEAGETYSFALIGMVSEEELNKFFREGKEGYLGTTTCFINDIPNDGNQVRFIKLDLTER